MKENYFDNPNTDEVRQERAQKKKKTSFGKVILIIIAMLVIAVGAFVLTIKIISPDFDLLSLLPKKPLSIVTIKPEEQSTDVETESVTQELTTEEPTTQPTTASPIAYLPIEDFAMDEAVKGNQLGNILGGGLVGSDMTYVYHIVNGSGIYRLNPATEDYTRVYKSADKLSSLNLRGDYLYFINGRDNALYRLKKGSQSPEELAQNVKTAYVYDNEVYYVTLDNRMCYMKLSKLSEKTLYNSADENMELLGVSLKRVFFTLQDISGGLRFMSADLSGKEPAQEFRAMSAAGEIEKPVMENGFIYYYLRQADGSYNLCRQKYGSPEPVTLAEGVSVISVYPVTDTNRVFFSTSEDATRFDLVELNMNSNKTKVMLSVSNIGEGNTLTLQHGGSYDFIIGRKSAEGKKVYYASGIYTGSTNVMKFKDGNWSY